MKNLAIAVILILGIFAMSANLENETKIGYVDKTYIMDRLPEYQKARVLLENFESDDTQEFNKAEANIKDLYAAIEELKEKSGDSKAEEMKLTRQIESFEKKKLVLKEQIEAERRIMWQKYTTEVRYKLERALHKAAGKNGYTHIFDKPVDGMNGELLIAPKQDDLTRKVMEILELKSEDYQLGK